VCHLAYIDVAANPDANELARKVAFDRARFQMWQGTM
jgi:hypothetical protein